MGIIKRVDFKPLYFNFPDLDRFPWLFRSRRRAFAITKEFEDLLYHLVRENPRKSGRKKSLDARDEIFIHALERALEQGRITDHQFRSNLKLIVLTGHENTTNAQCCVLEIGHRSGKILMGYRKHANPMLHDRDWTSR